MLFYADLINKRMGLYACKQALLFGVNLILSCKCDVMFRKTATHKIVLPLNDSESLPFGSKSVDNIRSIPNLRSLLDGGGADCALIAALDVKCIPCRWYAMRLEWREWRAYGDPGEWTCARAPMWAISEDEPGMFSASPTCRISAMQNEGFFMLSTPKPPEQYAVQRLKFDA